MKIDESRTINCKLKKEICASYFDGDCKSPNMKYFGECYHEYKRSELNILNPLNIFERKTICVFGGTGTIGSLIVEYLLNQNPYSIRVFCNDENSLWEKQQEWNNEKIRYLLGDIRDLDRVRRALFNVDYVFNCAAIKHVPFAEYNPLEAVQTNIIGLDNIITASIENKVKKLLHMSTDKAINPSCVMGASKMISERLLQIRWAQHPNIQMICVRSGNVLDSRGSFTQIINILKENNVPIKITDLEMTRFFIKQNEIVDFIIKAFKEGINGEIWVPILKETKIIDLIHEIVGDDYPIEVIGVRKGEKLHEKLLSNYEESIVNKESKYMWIIRNEYTK